MLKLNYFIHLILNSRYKLFINLFILLTIYIVLYGNNTVFCMNENTNTSSLPEVAEAKTSNSETPDLIKNIQAFAGSRASALENVIQEKDSIIAEKDQLLGKKDEFISLLNNHISRQEGAFAALEDIVKEHDPEACYYLAGSPPTFSDLEAKEGLTVRVSNATNSDDDYIHGDRRDPHFARGGSDSDNDFGSYGNDEDYTVPIDWDR